MKRKMIRTTAPYNNPFNSRRISTIRYRFESGNWSELVLRLKSINYRGAIIGPHGSGKTTLLEELCHVLAGEGIRCCYIGINNETSRLSKQQWRKLQRAAKLREVILFDGADILSRYSFTWLKWISRKAGGLIVTAHKTGFLPTVFECHPSKALFSKLVAELARDSKNGFDLDLGAIYQHHNLNMREAFRALYDNYAK